MAIQRQTLSALFDALRAVLRFDAPADGVLRGFFRDRKALGQADRALIAETVFGILRRKRWFDTWLPDVTADRLALAALVRQQGVGLKEIDGALNERQREWVRSIRTIEIPEGPLPVEADLPDWVVDALRPGLVDADILALGRALQRPAPLDLRVNTLRAPRDDVLVRLATEGLPGTATPYSPFGIRLEGKPAINRHPLFLDGTVEVQDEGSQLVALLVGAKRREMVVDFCAGAGGKTLALGAAMANQGRLYAFDVSRKRLDNLKPRLARSGLSNVHPTHLASERDPRVKRLHGKIDRVLVDAPCSGLGTLRRNPDLKWRQGPTDILEMSAKQSALLDAAAPLLKVGGRLVYATCSLLDRENEQVVEGFLAAHPDFSRVSCRDVLAASRIDLDTGIDLRLWPHVHGTDGFYCAILERTGPRRATEAEAPGRDASDDTPPDTEPPAPHTS